MSKKMIYSVFPFLLALCLFAGCGKSAPEAEAPEPLPQAESSGEETEVHLAEDSADSAWAAALSPKAPEQDRLAAVLKYNETGAFVSRTDYLRNADGRIIKESVTMADGSPSPDDYINTYEYQNGYLIARNAYDAAGALVYRYKYDESGNEVKWILYDEAGQVRMWLEDSFDEAGRITAHTMYEPGKEGTLMNAREYDCNEQGDAVECRYLSASGAIQHRYVYKYSYDAGGNVIYYEADDVNAGLVEECYSYSYDPYGKLIERCQLDAAGRCLIREVMEYDDAGHLLTKRLYSSDGLLAVTLEYKYQ